MAERPSPLSIALCTLIALHSDPSFDLYQERKNNDHKVEEELSRILQRWVLGHHDHYATAAVAHISSSTSRDNDDNNGDCNNNVDNFNNNSINNPLSQLLQQIEACAGAQTCQLVLEYVEISAGSLDALMDLMESLRASVSEGIVDGTSSTGIYLRKVCLGFDELSFEAATRLWEALRLNVNQAKQQQKAMTLSNNTNTNHSVVEVPLDASSSSWPPSSTQQENLLRYECLDSLDGNGSSSGGANFSFEQTEARIQRILARDPELPAAHFFRFFNCLQHGERLGALDSLHQYFDYAMIKDRKDVLFAQRQRSSNSRGSQPNTDGDHQDVLQYAAILLAAVHSAFGDKGLSLKATEEAVRVAQASGDMACVAYALGWLFQNNAKAAELKDEELLIRCSSRAVECCLQSLAGGANLSLGRHSLTSSSEMLPARAWASIMDASTDRITSSETATGRNLLDRPTHKDNLKSSKDVTRILSQQCLVGAGVWETFGFAPQSGLASFVGLQCHGSHMSANDIAVAMQNIARVALYGNGLQTTPVSCKTNDLHGFLQNLDNDGGGGDDDDVTNRSLMTPCAYEEALGKLNELKQMQPNPASSVWITSTVLLLHEWAVRRTELGYAASLACQLHSYLHPRISNFHELTVEALKQHSLLLCRQGQWDKATSLTKQLCTMSREWGLRTQHASLLMQLAMIHFEISPRHFIGALNPLLECLSLCESCSMDSYHATALSLLAKVHLQLQNTKMAVALLQGALPSILQHSHIWFQGEAYLTLAKCDLRQAKQCHAQGGNISRFLFSAVNHLDKSRKVFEGCQDVVRLREVYFLQARVYNDIPGHRDDRNEAAKQFRTASSCTAKASSPIFQNVLESLTQPLTAY